MLPQFLQAGILKFDSHRDRLRRKEAGAKVRSLLCYCAALRCLPSLLGPVFLKIPRDRGIMALLGVHGFGSWARALGLCCQLALLGYRSPEGVMGKVGRKKSLTPPARRAAVVALRRSRAVRSSGVHPEARLSKNER